MMIEIHALGTHFKRLIFRNGVVPEWLGRVFFSFYHGRDMSSVLRSWPLALPSFLEQLLVCSTGAGVFS